MNGYTRWVVMVAWLGMGNGNASDISGRDPFLPAVKVSCNEVSPSSLWTLRGLVGDATQWVGWLERPEKPWLRIRYGDLIQPEGLQVVRLDKTGVVFRVSEAQAYCGETEIMLASPFANKESKHG
ncbi:DUF2531 domain-containing protein [Pectobacteriaceae bacterium CE70]|nr:DUF2531 domain-containing protein [Pectobacteriaceae bacterium C52]WJV67256.1 DUF2531 domain-containing protein [Pectobacteriaceae bacterium CE70]WJY11237.1 DUF2531 domain-containing protein [Pectobacteriaceae bacterium C80]